MLKVAKVFANHSVDELVDPAEFESDKLAELVSNGYLVDPTVAVLHVVVDEPKAELKAEKPKRAKKAG